MARTNSSNPNRSSAIPQSSQPNSRKAQIGLTISFEDPLKIYDSSLPEGVKYLMSAYEARPTIEVTEDDRDWIKAMDEIVAGKNLERHGDFFADGLCLDLMLRSLNFWRGIEHALMWGRGDERPAPEMRRPGSEMLALRDTFLSDLTRVEATTWRYADGNVGDNILRLLMEYRLYTRFVIDLTKRVWPELDMRWLEYQW